MVAASNLANLDTPGYRTKEISFAAALDDELGASGIVTTNPLHIGNGHGLAVVSICSSRLST